MIALIVLAIAAINYMSMATSRFTERAQEVGVRKTLGAARRHVALQFFAESTFFTSTALAIALAIALVFLPLLNDLLGKRLSIGNIGDPVIIASLLGLVLITTLIAGSYPALYLSSFSPAAVLQGRAKLRKPKTWLRKCLVVAQFVASVVLIASALVVWRQVSFLQNKPLGFDGEHVVSLPVRGDAGNNLGALKDALQRHSDVLGVSAASGAPDEPEIGRIGTGDAGYDVLYLLVDNAYLETMDIELVRGRNLPALNGGGRPMRHVLLNEAAVLQLGWDDPIGRTFEGLLGTVEVVGVVADFHTLSLHRKIEPTVLQMAPPFFDALLVRLRPERIHETLSYLESQWSEFIPQRPFEFSFLDERIDTLYRSEERLARVIVVFAGLAIFTACLGLFGLAAFTAERRTQEIGVRKAMGASAVDIVWLLQRDFAGLVLLGIVVASPVAVVATNLWLEDFAYRIELDPLPFAWAAVAAASIALVTVSWHAFKAARLSPARSLKHK
jgi:putative ABC transport system permease protein